MHYFACATLTRRVLAIFTVSLRGEYEWKAGLKVKVRRFFGPLITVRPE